MNEQGRVLRINSGLVHVEYLTTESFVKEVLVPELVMD
jgi:hypothetical protein